MASPKIILNLLYSNASTQPGRNPSQGLGQSGLPPGRDCVGVVSIHGGRQ